MIRTRFFVACTFLGLAILYPESSRAHPAWGIVVDHHGRVFFADVDHGNAVWRIDERGRLSRVVTGKHSHDLFLDARGDLYVTDVAGEGDTWRSSLLRVTPTGAPEIVIPPTGDRKQFWGNAFTMGRDSNVYFGYRNNPAAGETKDEVLILKRRPDGRVSALAGGRAGRKDGAGIEAMFRSPGAMAWGPGGVLHVVDDDAIRKVAEDGTVTTVAEGLLEAKPADPPFEGANSLFGLAFDDRDNAYVADFGSRRVLKVAPDKKRTTVLRSERPWSPVGVASSGGDLYVLEVGFTPPRDYRGPRVRKLAADGSVKVLADVESVR